MCHAYEGEREYLNSREKWIRSKGYEAHKAGLPKTSNPEQDHEYPEYSDRRQWDFGWETAESGMELW